jgi:hypothetical protein
VKDLPGWMMNAIPILARTTPVGLTNAQRGADTQLGPCVRCFGRP